MYSEAAWVLVSSGTQVQPQIILKPDFLPDYHSVSYDYVFKKAWKWNFTTYLINHLLFFFLDVSNEETTLDENTLNQNLETQSPRCDSIQYLRIEENENDDANRKKSENIARKFVVKVSNEIERMLNWTGNYIHAKPRKVLYIQKSSVTS